MNLKSLRKLRGLSQAGLAEMIGADQSTIQRAESMHSSAKLATYIACAQALGVPLGDLFSEERSAIEIELLRVFRRIPESQHEHLLGLLRMAETHAPSKGQ